MTITIFSHWPISKINIRYQSLLTILSNSISKIDHKESINRLTITISLTISSPVSYILYFRSLQFIFTLKLKLQKFQSHPSNVIGFSLISSYFLEKIYK